ncbi:MAG: hypothetical protein U1F42_07405 [Candidatus Competibacteraceae bacterium]
MAKLDPKATPTLLSSESLTANSPDKTLYLNIDLSIQIAKGQAAATALTAAFSPDPTQLGSTVDVLLWFHGHKGQLNKTTNLKGYSAQQYLSVNEFKFREFILSTSKRKFLFVMPTLGDTSGAGVLGEQAQAEAFLQQVVNGVKANMNKNVTGIGNIVLAAHSGGGAIMSKMIGYGGMFSKVREIWCIDSTYQSGSAFTTWAKQPGHTLDRLWVFSTGSWDVPDQLKFPKQPAGPDNPVIIPHHRAGTGDNARVILNYAKKSKSKNIEVLIKPMPPESNRINFNYGVAGGHNESVGFYFPQLVKSSRTLS